MSAGPVPSPLVNAICVPSGDQAGNLERVRLPVGSGAIPDPSGFIVKTVAVGVFTAKLANAIFPFAPGKAPQAAGAHEATTAARVVTTYRTFLILLPSDPPRDDLGASVADQRHRPKLVA
jgi:hypothetical protein